MRVVGLPWHCGRPAHINRWLRREADWSYECRGCGWVFERAEIAEGNARLEWLLELGREQAERRADGLDGFKPFERHVA